MDHVRVSILTTAFIVLIGCATDPYGPVTYNKSDLDKLLKTNACPGCNLSGADLRGGFMGYAHLSGANLSGAHLDGAMLVEADLTNANLSGAKLHDATLRNANLTGANLDGAIVVGACFLDAKGLSTEQVEDLKRRGAVFHERSL